ncbi:MAG: BtaA family protein [Oscillospiraceae bacterium]|nr:BtaA family protein [Oscillospiraceae bacterium]
MKEIRYSNCWEDTKVLQNALEIKPGETGISIASAGDNTFAILMQNPEKVIAFDRNRTQLWLCELKMAAFRALDYHEMLAFFGVCRGPRIIYYDRIRSLLSADARDYFDEHAGIIEKGILHAGKFEGFFHIFRKCILPLFSSVSAFETFARMEDVRQQKEFFEKYINTRRLEVMFQLYFGWRVMGKLGRDLSCYDYVSEKEHSGNDIRERFIYGVSHTSNISNAYLNYIVTGNYTPLAMPVYLQKRNYEVIRNRLDALQLVHSDLQNLEIKGVQFANLSDIFEYMSEDEFAENIEILTDMMDRGGRMAYWNMQNRRYPGTGMLMWDEARSKTLFTQNRSWFYRDFRLYRKTI